MAGRIGTNEQAVQDILNDKDLSDADMVKIISAYQEKYDGSLVDSIRKEFSGKVEDKHIDRIADLLVDQAGAGSADAADVLAVEFYAATEGRKGTTDDFVDAVLNSNNDAAIKALVHSYSKVNNSDIFQAIRGDYSFKKEDEYVVKVLEAIIGDANTPITDEDAKVLADQLYLSTGGKLGTDKLVVNTILQNKNLTPEDMVKVVSAYQADYGSLIDTIEKDFSGAENKKLQKNIAKLLTDAIDNDVSGAVEMLSNEIYASTEAKTNGTHDYFLECIFNKASDKALNELAHNYGNYNSGTDIFTALDKDLKDETYNKYARKLNDAMQLNVNVHTSAQTQSIQSPNNNNGNSSENQTVQISKPIPVQNVQTPVQTAEISTQSTENQLPSTATLPQNGQTATINNDRSKLSGEDAELIAMQLNSCISQNQNNSSHLIDESYENTMKLLTSKNYSDADIVKILDAYSEKYGKSFVDVYLENQSEQVGGISFSVAGSANRYSDKDIAVLTVISKRLQNEVEAGSAEATKMLAEEFKKATSGETVLSSRSKVFARNLLDDASPTVLKELALEYPNVANGENILSRVSKAVKTEDVQDTYKDIIDAVADKPQLTSLTKYGFEEYKNVEMSLINDEQAAFLAEAVGFSMGEKDDYFSSNSSLLDYIASEHVLSDESFAKVIDLYNEKNGYVLDHLPTTLSQIKGDFTVPMQTTVVYVPDKEVDADDWTAVDFQQRVINKMINDANNGDEEAFVNLKHEVDRNLGFEDSYSSKKNILLITKGLSDDLLKQIVLDYDQDGKDYYAAINDCFNNNYAESIISVTKDKILR